MEKLRTGFNGMTFLPKTYPLSEGSGADSGQVQNEKAQALQQSADYDQDDETLDKTGIWMSILCLIHCVGLPLLALLIPALESVPGNDVFIHGVALFLIVPVAYLSFLKGFRVHKKTFVPVVGFLGVGLLVIAFLYEETALHSVITSTGGIALVIGHLLNLRLSHKRAPHCSRYADS